ncbi:hypothetical protein [Isoptericola sp. b408]|uniref:hypothetical protein n=1 Tax=Isoptericola sp. b408 TaxID=3064653 RepID=UPI002713E663|nr:hypothetical protein [Isoptericola sp. b408]MDO8151854.1 hypothetical protein [Isoptericola sp. b408]
MGGLVACAILSAVVAAAAPDDNRGFGGKAENQEVTVWLAEQEALVNSSGGDSASDTRYFRATVHYCLLSDLENTVLRDVCDEGTETIATGIDCPDDAFALAGLFAVTLAANGAESAPRLISEGTCVTAADLEAEAERAFRNMPVEPAQIHLEIERDWAIVNFGIHPRTDDTDQVMDTTLLGVPVQVRAYPAEYTWDAGDDTTPITTDHPGGRWDSADAINLPYPEPGTFTASLTTTWHGQFRITGTPTWTDIDGELTTTDSTDPIEVHDAEVRLTG